MWFIYFGWLVGLCSVALLVCRVWVDSLRVDVVCGLIVLVVDSFAFVSFYLTFGCLSLLRFGACFVCCLLVSWLVVVCACGLPIELWVLDGLVVAIGFDFGLDCVEILFFCTPGLPSGWRLA